MNYTEMTTEEAKEMRLFFIACGQQDTRINAENRAKLLKFFGFVVTEKYPYLKGKNREKLTDNVEALIAAHPEVFKSLGKYGR